MRSESDSDHRSGAAVAPAAAFDDLARMVAHEVRNALSPLRVAAQGAQASPDSDAARLAARVISTVDRISVLTEALLDRQLGEADVVDVREMIEEIVANCSTGNVTVSGELEQGGPPLRIRSHEPALWHLLQNLISNAIRVTRDRGNVEIDVRRSTWNTDRSEASGVRISVRDHGPGLPQAAIDRLSTTAESECAFASASGGVGLEIVRRLASLLGAEVRASNEPGAGARVDIFVPTLASAASIAA